MSELFPARTIALEYVDCTDAQREYRFNHWYNTVHLPKLRQIPGVKNVYRYRNMAKELREGQSGYLNIYRLLSEDPRSVVAQIQERQQRMVNNHEVIDCCKFNLLTLWDFLTFRHRVLPHTVHQLLPDGMPEAMLVVPSVCTDPDRDAEFNEWYLYTHHHDLLETPGLVQAHRYRNSGENHEIEGKYLALYEIDDADPAAVVKKILEDDRSIRIPQGRMIDCIRATYGFGTYRHIDI